MSASNNTSDAKIPTRAELEEMYDRLSTFSMREGGKSLLASDIVFEMMARGKAVVRLTKHGVFVISHEAYMAPKEPPHFFFDEVSDFPPQSWENLKPHQTKTPAELREEQVKSLRAVKRKRW